MESVRRTLQLANVMKRWRATEAGMGHPGLPPEPTSGDPRDDTERVLRYLAKVTIEPAIVHGLAEVRRVAPAGRLADIVLWKPAWFGVKPELVLKAGMIGLGAARRGQRVGRARRTDPLSARLGRHARGGPAARRHVRRAGSERRAPAPIRQRARASSRSGGRAASRAPICSLNRATAPIEIDPRDGRVTLAGRRSRRRTRLRGAAQPALLPALTQRPGAQAQMSPIVNPSGKGSVGSTT